MTYRVAVMVLFLMLPISLAFKMFWVYAKYTREKDEERLMQMKWIMKQLKRPKKKSVIYQKSLSTFVAKIIEYPKTAVMKI